MKRIPMVKKDIRKKKVQKKNNNKEIKVDERITLQKIEN